MKHLIVKSIPIVVERDTLLEINTKDVSYFTHGFFKYPCKFIPQIPLWGINKYTKEGDIVLDPFAGSGTTLVEAVLNKRNALAVDFDPLSRLLTNVKTHKLNISEQDLIEKYSNYLFEENKEFNKFIPTLNNLDHWFPEENIKQLATIKSNINKFYPDNKHVKDFLLVCYASIIRKSSHADASSPKPYVSKRIDKIPLSPNMLFEKSLKLYLSKINEFNEIDLGKFKFIGTDARNINQKGYKKSIDLAFTSPPYINAFDYVRSLRLENLWLDFYSEETIIEHKRKQIGTEYFKSSEYKEYKFNSNYSMLNNILEELNLIDKKRAYIVLKYFEDMRKNFESIKSLLKDGGHYIVVIGNSRIRNIDIQTSSILVEIAEDLGFTLENKFSYVIKNRYLRIPRNEKGGLIKTDCMLDFKLN